MPEHKPVYNATVKAIASLGELTPVRAAQAEGLKVLAIKVDQLYSTKDGNHLNGLHVCH